MKGEILLAIRVGSPSEEPARVARELAQRLDSHVTVLHVTPELKPFELVGSEGLSLDDMQSAMLQESEAGLAEFVQAHLRGVRTSTRIAKGPVAEQVAAVADDVNADYVVVGTQGRGTLARLVLGDTTQSILQHSTRPVLVVPLLSDEARPD